MPRSDEVEALAARLGAQAGAGRCSRFKQEGCLRNIGEERWTKFTATQWAATDRLAFCWRARVGPLGLIGVEDALIDDLPVGRVRALGIVPLSSAKASAELLKGELQRYLAELPWNPDALLSNPLLRWEAGQKADLTVSARIGSVEASVAIHLDDHGFPAHITALRPAMEQDGFVEREWVGDFADYERIDGRLIPREGRVAWKYEGDRFEVWRGSITDWRLSNGD